MGQFVKENAAHSNDSGMEHLDWILSRMEAVHRQNNPEDLSDAFVRQDRWYWNVHLFPQMFFLNDARWIAHPVDYVALIEHEKEAFLWLLDRFVDIDTAKYNISEIMENEWHVLRNRKSDE